MALLFAGMLNAQVPGSLIDPATPAFNPLDPNGDGFITSTGVAFSGPTDEAQFELPFLPVQQYAAEPSSDNQYSAGCEFYELVNDPSSNADAGYYYYSNPDGIPENGDELVFFRFRLARFSNGSTAFSFLIDTDYRFGFIGPEADPNAVIGNPGFEREIAVFNNTGTSAGVRVFNADGTSSPTIVSFVAPISTHYQVAYTLNQAANCSASVPVFVDMFVPFSALGISSADQIRICVAANEDVGSSLGGGASDIGGVDGTTLSDDDEQFIAAINGFSPVALINPTNTAPLALNTTVYVDENSTSGTVVHIVSATDTNGDVLTWSIAGGNSGDAFTIDPANGVIMVNNSALLDRETSPSFVLLVRVSDGQLYDNAVISIQLNDVNEPPTVQDAEISVAEHPALNAVIFTFGAIDPDVSATLVYSITGGNGEQIFNINSSTGEIAVENPGLLDFETAINTRTITVTVTDGFFSDAAQVTIHVTDVNEAPSIGDATVWIDENTPSGSLVTTVTAGDPDSGSALQYSIIAGNTADVFSIDDLSGAISVNKTLALDFETNPSFFLKIMVSDGLLSAEAIITITLKNVNEEPIVHDATLTVPTGIVDNDIVYTVDASDPDFADVLQFTLITGGSLFSIDSYTGDIRINDLRRFSPGPWSVELVVRVIDQGGLSATGNVIINRRRERSDIQPQKGFSPDGDGQNDFWLIKGIEAFPENFIQVFNRWGLLVFEASGYNNNDRAWFGQGNSSKGAEGTYYYIITAGDFAPITGYLIMKP